MNWLSWSFWNHRISTHVAGISDDYRMVFPHYFTSEIQATAEFPGPYFRQKASSIWLWTPTSLYKGARWSLNSVNLDQFSTKDPRSVRYGVTQTPNPSPPLFYALLSGISWIWMLNLLRDLIFTLAYPYGASQSVRIGWGCSVISLSHLNTVPSQAYTAQFPVTLQMWVGGWPLTTSLNANHTVGQ
jgi:hypothetical protein